MNIKKIIHWTPRYIYNRLQLAIYGILHPEDPWLTKDAIFIIGDLLKNSDIGIEFGSGRSTAWFAKRVKKLISIEGDEFWFKKVKEKLNKDNIENVDYVLKSKENYTDVFNNIENNSIDFVLVDGLVRDICAKKSILKLKSGGILIIDNINWFAPSDTYAPTSMHNNNFESELWRDIFEKDIKNWRKIWTSNGVTDTLIAFKSDI